MSTATLERLDEALLADTGMVACQSILHAKEGTPTHEAHWYAATPCHAVIPVCEERRLHCQRQGGWRCTACPGAHLYDDITFTKL